MDNNEDMKVPYEIRPEGTDTTLSEIAMQHQQSVNYYKAMRDAMEEENPGAAEFLESLSEYHGEMLAEINNILSDMSGGVHTPSRSGETVLKMKEKELNRAIQTKNITQMTSLAHENELGLSDTYRHALGNGNLIEFAEELLHEQHQKILVWVNRADRYKTVPLDDQP